MKMNIVITDESGNTFGGEFNLSKIVQRVNKNTSKSNKKKIMKPSEAIMSLYKNKFFKQYQNLNQVSQALTEKGFNFEKGSITMSLKGAEYLIKSGSKRNYKFIQKYPAED